MLCMVSDMLWLRGRGEIFEEPRFRNGAVVIFAQFGPDGLLTKWGRGPAKKIFDSTGVQLPLLINLWEFTINCHLKTAGKKHPTTSHWEDGVGWKHIMERETRLPYFMFKCYWAVMHMIFFFPKRTGWPRARTMGWLMPVANTVCIVHIL